MRGAERTRLRGWRSAAHECGGNGEICAAVGRRRGKQAGPTAVAAGILGWQTQAMGCLKCLACSVVPNICKMKGAGVGATGLSFRLSNERGPDLCFALLRTGIDFNPELRLRACLAT